MRYILLTVLAAFAILWLIFGCSGGSSGSGPDAPASQLPANSDTRIYGKVINAKDDSPFAGAQITVVGVQGKVSTDGQGRFAFPVPGAGTYSVTAEYTGYTYAQREAILVKGDLVTVADMYLTPLDAKVISIGPGGGKGTNSDGSIEVDAPAGALSSAAQLRATWYDRGRELPNFLPSLSHFTYACELTPDGQTFAQPVTMRIKNEWGFSPGTPIPVGVYDPKTLKWTHESMATVTQDGKWAEYQVTHFSPRDINLAFASPTGSDEPGSARDVSDGVGTKVTKKNNHPCSSVGGGSQIGIADGHLSLDHILPSYKSLDERRTVMLQYNSQRVLRTKLLGLNYDISQTSVLAPERIHFTVSVGGKRIERFFTPITGPMSFQYRWDGKDGMDKALPPGVYPYELTLANEYNAEFALTSGFGQPPTGGTGIQAGEYVSLSSTFEGKVELDPVKASPFGRGWGIVGLYRLESLSDGAKIIGGNGASFAFTYDQGKYEPSSGDFSKLEPTPSGDGFTWTMTDLSTFTFDASGRQTAAADRNGNTTTFTYDSAGRLEKITDPMSKVTLFYYDPTGIQVTITDPFGRMTEIIKSPAGDLVQIRNPDFSTRKFSYNSEHLLINQTGAGGKVTSYVYKTSGALSRVDRADGTSTTYEGLVLVNDFPSGTGTEKNPYSFATGTTPSFTNGESERYAFEVNGYGTRTSITGPSGRKALMTRDGDDLVTQLTLPTGRSTSYQYGNMGNLEKYSSGVQTVDITYDAAANLPKSILDHTVGTWTMTYDAKGNLDTATLPMGKSYTFKYNSYGQPSSETTGTQATSYTYDSNGNLQTLTDPTNATWSFSHDTYGNLAEIEDPDGRTWSAKYSKMNLIEEVTNGAGDVVKFSYSSALGSTDLTGNDQVAVVSSVTDGRGNVTSLEYDDLYQLTGITDAEGNKTLYTYDKAGRVKTLTRPSGAKVTYTYNMEGQLTKKELSTGETYAYVYNATTGLLESTSSTPAGHQLKLSHDSYDRLSQVDTVFPATPSALTVRLDYDYRDWNDYESYVQMSVATDYHQFSYNYNVASGPLPISHSAGFFWLNLSYDSAYRTSRWDESYNWARADFSYDQADRLTGKDYQYWSSMMSDYVTAFEAGWQYSDGGMLVQMTDPDGTHQYTYDGAGRIIGATHPTASNPTEAYTYDAAGNRRVKGQETGFTFDKANRLTADPQFTYEYDKSGNLIKKTDKSSSDVTTYAYDAENRLKSVSLPGAQNVTFTYDPVGRLIEKDTNGGVVRYVHDGDEMLGLYYSNGTLIKSYINGQRIDDMEGVMVGSFSSYTNYYYYTDPLGTVLATGMADGTVHQAYRYQAFGQPVGSTTNSRFFHGLEYEMNSGLYYVRNRFYDPSTGRFLQRDPLPLLAAIEPYAYASNSPTMLRDPHGLEPKSPWGGLGDVAEDKIVNPVKNKQIKDFLGNMPEPEDYFGHNKKAKWNPYRGTARAMYDMMAHHGGTLAEGFDQYTQWKDVINVWTAKCPLESGINWFNKQWWNPVRGKMTESVLTLGGQLARRPATLKEVKGLRGGLRNFFGR